MECYVFETEAEAIAAESFISSAGGCPRKGKRKGVVTNDGQTTERWAVPQRRATDGKWWFKRVHQKFLATAAPEVVSQFRQNYSYNIENYSPLWEGDV